MGFVSWSKKTSPNVIHIIENPTYYNQVTGAVETEHIKTQPEYYFYHRVSSAESTTVESDRRYIDRVTVWLPFYGEAQKGDIFFIEDMQYQVEGVPKHYRNGRNINVTEVTLFRVYA